MFRYLKQIASESLVYGLTGVISRFLTVFLTPIYTRLFTPEDYGVMSLIITTMAFVGSLVGFSLDSAAHRWYWDSEAEDHRKSTLATWAWCALGSACMFAVLMFAMSHWLAHTLVRRSDAALYFSLAALSLPLSVLGIVANNWFRMQRRPWGAMIFSLGTNLLTILLTLLLVVALRWGLLGIYLAQVITTTVSMVIACVLLRDWINPKWFQWLRLKEMLRYALPMVPAAVTSWTVKLSASYFVQFFSSTSEVGLYSIGGTLASGVVLVTSAFQLAWIPFAMSIHKQADAKEVYANVLLVYSWLLCLTSVALSLFAPEILRVLTTHAYFGASSVVAPLAFGYVMLGFATIASTGPAIVKNVTPYVVGVTLAAGLTIGLNFLLVPAFGKEGSAFATLIAQTAIPIYMFYRAQQLYPIPYQFGLVGGMVLWSWVLVLVCQIWQVENLLLGIIFKAVLLASFFPALLALRIIPKRKLQLVPHTVK